MYKEYNFVLVTQIYYFAAYFQNKSYLLEVSYFNCSINTYSTMAKKPIGTTASTGHKCPESGVWKVVGTPTTTAPIAEGNTMPPYNGSAVTWKLIQYA
jgi:hypothetical protein